MSAPPERERLVEVRGLRAGYGRTEVIHDASISVCAGEVVGMMGHNGAGKSTLLRSIMGLADVSHGEVRIAGRSVVGERPATRVRHAVGYVPDGRQIFPELTVADNVRLARSFTRAAVASRDGARTFDDDRLAELFPVLPQRRKQLAGLMSGGEQQMLSIAMALVAGPDLMILDEPSLGLSPVVTERVFAVVRRLREEFGLSVLIVEQNVHRLMSLADRVYVMKLGRIVAELDPSTVDDRDLWDYV
jgi:branched-chain amino acid transport system ATP-binding protein